MEALNGASNPHSKHWLAYISELFRRSQDVTLTIVNWPSRWGMRRCPQHMIAWLSWKGEKTFILDIVHPNNYYILDLCLFFLVSSTVLYTHIPQKCLPHNSPPWRRTPSSSSSPTSMEPLLCKTVRWTRAWNILPFYTCDNKSQNHPSQRVNKMLPTIILKPIRQWFHGMHMINIYEHSCP